MKKLFANKNIGNFAGQNYLYLVMLTELKMNRSNRVSILSFSLHMYYYVGMEGTKKVTLIKFKVMGNW